MPVQDTLRAAAIVGREFEFEMLRAMGDLDEDELIDALGIAEHAQLVTAVKRSGVSFAFAHALIPLTLHEGLSALRRQRLHRRAAQAIERVAERADRLASGDFAAALGRHYAEAGDLEKAIEYYIQAGERARGVYAYHEAIGHCQHALAALNEISPAELTRAARTAMTLGQLYHTVFEFEHSQQAYQEGFALWQRVEEGAAGGIVETKVIYPDGTEEILPGFADPVDIVLVYIKTSGSRQKGQPSSRDAEDAERSCAAI